MQTKGSKVPSRKSAALKRRSTVPSDAAADAEIFDAATPSKPKLTKNEKRRLAWSLMSPKRKAECLQKMKQFKINQKAKMAQQNLPKIEFDDKDVHSDVESKDDAPKDAEDCPAVDQYKLVCKKADFVTEFQIAGGGMAVVSAVKQGTDRYVLKSIPTTATTKKETSKVFQREIINLGLMSHRNIIRFYGFFESTRNIYMLFERGAVSVENLLETEKRFEEYRAASYIHQICSGLQHMHALGVTHRDIKPSNLIMMCDLETVKLADFGSTSRANMKKSTTFVGSAEYIAPEVIEGSAYTSSVDLWAVGVCFYEFLTGKTPFADGRGCHSKALFTAPESMSKEAKKVISKLLELAQGKRMTAEKIVSNQWIHKMVGEQERAIVRRQSHKINNYGSRGKQEQQTGYKPAIDRQTQSDSSGSSHREQRHNRLPSTVSFEDVLKSKTDCALFRKFLQKEYSENNLEFYLECEKFKNIMSPRVATIHGEGIYLKYIAEDAECQVNLEGTTRSTVHKQVEDGCEPGTFKAAQAEIFQLMATDSYKRFLRDPLFKEFGVTD